MISKVTIEKSTYNESPFRFEAGTPHVSGAVGLHSALDFIERIGLENIHEFENKILDEATNKLSAIEGVEIYGTSLNKGPIISFNIQGAHYSDVAQIVDQEGVALRAGHHCTQPLMSRLKVTGTLRASFSIYNDSSDIDAFVKAVAKAREMLL